MTLSLRWGAIVVALGLSLSAAAAPGTSIIVPSLGTPAGRWDLDECLDGKHVSPWGRNAVACAAGVSGAASSFDGVDDLIEVPDSAAYHFTAAMTASAWVMPRAITGMRTIVSKWYAPDSYMLLIQDGQITFAIALAGANGTTWHNVAAPISAGVWTHVAGTFDGYTMQLYVNGSPVSSLKVPNAPRSLQQSTRAIAIGGHPTWNAYAGLIDEVRLYDRALSSMEMRMLATAQDERAMILVDARLYPYVASRLSSYRDHAERRRGFAIGLHVIQNLDGWYAKTTKRYLEQHHATYEPATEGALLVGNVRLPSFYKNRNDLPNTRLLPRFFEDLDGVFTKHYADGETDPRCPTNEPWCAVNGPVAVPAHDFDYTEKGGSPHPEIWVALMPVGAAISTFPPYAGWAKQLNPYLDKVIRYYQGYARPNGRFYMVSNDKGETFDLTWKSWPRSQIDLYGKPGPNGETGDKCLTPDGNVCYVRWPLEDYATYEEFDAAYKKAGWVGEGWQTPEIFIPHMNAALYDVVEVNVHSAETFSLISAAQARTLSNAGLIVALSGCSVLGFRQPDGSNVDTKAFVADNIAMAYLYGSSRAIAALGDPFSRGHYAHFPTMWYALKSDGTYLGLAHYRRMQTEYDLAGSDAFELRERGMEMLVGDPFMDLGPRTIP